jgi:hypothetical protein
MKISPKLAIYYKEYFLSEGFDIMGVPKKNFFARALIKIIIIAVGDFTSYPVYIK